LVVVFVLAASAVWATSVVPLSDEELFGGAELVVVGTVTTMKVVDRPGEKPAFVTDVALDVTEALKGKAGKSLIVRVPGGRTDSGMGMMIPGSPVFKEGDTVLLALERWGDAWRLRGYFQGRYTVLTPGKGDATIVVRDPWKRIVTTYRGCADGADACLAAVPDKRTLKDVRGWSAAKP
jgi:hypothetical protein